MLPNRPALEHRLTAAPSRLPARLGALLLTACAVLSLLPPMAARAQGGLSGDSIILDAREALRKHDRSRLAADRAVAMVEQHPLAMWVEYWELTNRIADVQVDEAEAFYARWSGSYVEDRFRNDWLLELGRRRDWPHFVADYPRFRMNDDREVSCYALLTDQLAGKDVRAEARAAWAAQKDADIGCSQMANAQYQAQGFGRSDIWRRARLALDAGRPRAAQQAAEILGIDIGQAVAELIDSPVKYLAKRGSASTRDGAELATLALLRVAGNEPNDSARLLDERWSRTLPADLAAWAWASTGRQSAQRLDTEAPGYFDKAELRLASSPSKTQETRDIAWSDDTLAWKVRAAVRASAGVGDSVPRGAGRWLQVVQGVDAMSAAEQRDAGWTYWKARALLALAAGSADGDAQRTQARELLQSIATQLSFYGTLAAEDLGQPFVLPPRPAAASAPEREAAAASPGLTRALQLVDIGLRNEGVREWNYALRGMGDRELLAAAQRACERELWDRCINTSERTRGEIDMAQRFPLPHRNEVLRSTKEVGVDPAYVYGLIRQESRFITDARSGAGASGLMQIMPATARWTAKRIGVTYSAGMINDRDMNLRLGTNYLKLALDDFGGSQALAAAAYNAGPGRPRKWREGPILEVAAWTENIPFPETRDYVKKVLSNATYYAALIGAQPQSLKARLGRMIGPRDSAVPDPAPDLP